MNLDEAFKLKGEFYPYLKKGRKGYECYVCTESTVYRYRQNDWWKINYDYYKFGSKNVCTGCFIDLLQHPELDHYSKIEKGKINRKELYKDYLNVLSDKNYHEFLNEQKRIEEFIEDSSYYYKRLKNAEFLVKLRGVSYEGREELVQKMNGEEILELRRERENKHDKNAISIHTVVDGKKVKIGYTPADFSEKIAPKMDSGSEVTAEIDTFIVQTYTKWNVVEIDSGINEFEKYDVEFLTILMRIRIVE